MIQNGMQVQLIFEKVLSVGNGDKDKDLRLRKLILFMNLLVDYMFLSIFDNQ